MATPTIEPVRPGVAFSPAAAASFRRAEADLGRQISTNSTYRDWVKQLLMHNAWNRYVRGQGPYPGHSMALHPDRSKHCQGLAMDSNEWVSATFNSFMAERGWIRTAASDPTERHHYEYQQWRDQHINRPASTAATPIIPELPEEEDMKVVQNHWKNPDGSIGRIVYVPGTAWYFEWSEPKSNHANAFAKQYDTGSSVEVDPSIPKHIRAAGDRCAK